MYHLPAYLHTRIWNSPQQAAAICSDHPQPIDLRYHHNGFITGPLDPVAVGVHQQQEAVPAKCHCVYATPGQASRRDTASAVKLTQLLAEVCAGKRTAEQQVSKPLQPAVQLLAPG